MNKIFVAMLLALMSTNSYSWYCNEVASERNGDTINACGIGESVDEDSARKISLNNAYKELDLICSHSADCANQALDITPLRTDCKKIESGYRCHRGVTALITSSKRDLAQKNLLEEVFVPKKIVQLDGRSAFSKTSIVDFTSNPIGASIHVDGVEVCIAPCSREITQGEHKVTFDLPGFDLKSNIHLIKDGRQEIEHTLISSYGYVSINNLPSDAVVKIDNKETSSRENIRLSPNEHIITVEHPYHQPWHKQFTINKGDAFTFDYDSEALNGFVKISAEDEKGHPIEASIRINGRNQSQKTPAVIKVDAGENNIVLSHPQYKDLHFNTTVDVNENQTLKKQLILAHIKNWMVYLGLGMSNPTFEEDKQTKGGKDYSCCILIDVSLQRMLAKYLGIRVSYNYINDMSSSEAKIEDTRGPANTTEFRVTGLVSNQISVSLPIYLYRKDEKNFFIAPEVGSVNTELVYEKNVYGMYGIQNKTDDARKDKFHQAFSGVKLGLEWIGESANSVTYGFHITAGARKYNDSNKSEVDSKAPDTYTGRVYKGNLAAYAIGGMIFAF